MTIYYTPQGKERILKLYDQNWAALGLETERCFVPTRYGQTHVVICGPREAPPLVAFHGGNVISPLSFAWIQPLTEHFRMYAPDTIGHPGYSAETRLKPGGFQYGEWAADVLDGLELEQPAVMGGSYGAGILLNLAGYAPQKIGKAVLVVPSGFAPPPMIDLMTRMAFPMMMYRLTRKRSWLVSSLTAMYPEPDENVVAVTGAIFENVKIEAQMPRSIRPEDLKDFHAPTLVLAAEKDVLFPAAVVIRRARQVVPNLVAAEVIAGSTHYLPEDQWAALCARIQRFLQMGT
jgi:pimeloyl-ACP methyl ester carboxylesterase